MVPVHPPVQQPAMPPQSDQPQVLQPPPMQQGDIPVVPSPMGDTPVAPSPMGDNNAATGDATQPTPPTGQNQTPNTAQNNNQQSIQQQFDNLANQQQAFNPTQNVAQATGNPGAPNIIGDFIGLTTTSTLQTASFAPVPTVFAGGPLDGLSFASTGSSSIDVLIPQGSVLGGAQLAQDVTLSLSSSGSSTLFDTVTGVTNQDALNNWLGQGGSALTNVSGTFLSEGAIIEATTSGGGGGGGGLGGGGGGGGGGGSTTADVLIDGDLLRGGFAADQTISLPRAGVQVSKYRSAENSSPVPRDRVLFNVNEFYGVNFTGQRRAVNRFVPGFEKTFANGTASWELQLPFAATFDNFQPATDTGFISGATDTEFGNISSTFKKIIFRNDNLLVSAGMAVELPTSEDLIVESSISRIQRKAESINLNPFIGSLFTHDRFFMQSVLQFSFDTNGEDVVFYDKRTQSEGVGKLREAPLIFGDISTGWWFYRDEEATAPTALSGLAGLVEIHMTQTLQDTDVLAMNVGGTDYQFGDASSIGVANLTAGATMEFGRKSTITVAYATPLTDTDRQFDGELQVLLNYYVDGLGSGFRNPWR